MNHFYHEGSRALQDEFGTRALADRNVQLRLRDRFTEDDAAYIARRIFFFLATADAALRAIHRAR